MTQSGYAVECLVLNMTEAQRELHQEISRQLALRLRQRLAFEKVVSAFSGVLDRRDTWELAIRAEYWANLDEWLTSDASDEAILQRLRSYLDALLCPEQSVRVRFSLTCRFPGLTVIVNQIMPLCRWSDQNLSPLIIHALSEKFSYQKRQTNFGSGARKEVTTVTIALNPLE